MQTVPCDFFHDQRNRVAGVMKTGWCDLHAHLLAGHQKVRRISRRCSHQLDGPGAQRHVHLRSRPTGRVQMLQSAAACGPGGEALGNNGSSPTTDLGDTSTSACSDDQSEALQHARSENDAAPLTMLLRRAASSRVYCASAAISSKNRGYMPTITPSVGLMFSNANLNASRTVSWLLAHASGAENLEAQARFSDLPDHAGHRRPDRPVERIRDLQRFGARRPRSLRVESCG